MTGSTEERTLRFDGMSLTSIKAAPTTINYKTTIVFEGDPDAFDYNYARDYIPKRPAKNVSGVEIPLDLFRFGSLKLDAPGMIFATISIGLDPESVEVAKIKVKITAMMDHETFVSVATKAAREVPSTGIELVMIQSSDVVQGDIMDSDEDEQYTIPDDSFDPDRDLP